MLPEVGELVFSFVVGYIGALEFLYVARHLYHWGFRHNLQARDYKSEAESLRKLQEQLKNAIAEAKEKEARGLKAMKDGVMYKDGFRMDEDQKKIEELKEKVRIQEMITERQREIEAELERQKKIEEETRKQLKKAEEELRRVEEEKKREKQKAEEEKRKAEEEKKKAEEEEKRKAELARKKAEDEKRKAEEEEIKRKQKAAEEENMRKIVEAEKKKEEEQRRLEEERENERKLLQAEKEREEKQRLLELEAQRLKEEEEKRENERKLLQAEKEREEKQRLLELEAQRQKEEELRRQEEEKENERKLLQAEKEREEKQRLLELEAQRKREEEREREEKQRLLEIEAQKQREEEQRRQEEEERENERKLLEAEREREEQQRQQEIEDEKIVQKLLQAERERELEEKERTRKLLEAERLQMEQEQAAERERQILAENEAALERENTAKLIAAEQEAILKQRELEENEENFRNLLKAERELELKKQEMEEEAANLQRLIEAEKQMEERQRKIDEEALEKLKSAQEEIELRQALDSTEEEAFVKKEIAQADQSIPQTVKTQYGQKSNESFKPKTMLFSGVSEESSSTEPVSSLQSSFSTQQSSEGAMLPELHFDEYERQAPDGGEDMPSLQYSDDYLRSLDGIKNKPLVREDGSGRRRAFKKRRSSGSSTSSRESRASREEELKMFTSLEEEEFENIRKGDSEYETIKYSSEPNLKVGKQHRRHKRSPAKDAKRDPNDKGSLEMLNEEDSNPWGEVKPENYKNTEFWKRESNLSIDEEQEQFDAKQRVQSPSQDVVNIPKMSSFEEATKSQHEGALLALKRQRSKDPEPIQEPDEDSETKNVSKVADARLSPAGSISSPTSASASISPASASLSNEPKRESSLETEENKTRTPSPNTGLRRSPRVEEMREYEEKWKLEDQKARAQAGENPDIEIQYASDEEHMSPEHLMEGISDFYDFNASINPSRSRSRTRSKSPAINRSVSLPDNLRRTPSPLNYSHIPARSKSRSPSPDPASYKFIVQRIIPSLDADQPQTPDHGLSDFYDFNTKLNRETLPGATTRASHEAHRTSVDYVLEDLKIEIKEKIHEGGAIPKNIEELKNTPTTPEYDRSISAEMRDIQKIKQEIISGSFKRSTYVGESMDFSDEFESLREEAKTFRRSRSRSRSPVYDDTKEMTARLLAKKQLQESILEDIRKHSEKSDDFSSNITKKMVDRNRRASDTELIQKPEILFQIQDLIEETDENFNIIECDPEEYHHFRRFSLGQEIPVEEYPEEYTYISEIEIKPLVEIEVLQEVEPEENKNQNLREEVIEEAYESGSDDERQTVVEVDDEIDEDIWEYNERPAEESHNEQSECEEADREIDRYAGRNADDWRDVEGAVGGMSDEDSFQIDRIYDEAIKNRKPSGILRDYDCILKEIQVSDEDRLEEENLLENAAFSNGNVIRNLDPGVWSPRSRSSRGSSRESSRSLIEYERRDNEMRYLADPAMAAINSTRLRSRYGIVPSTSLPTGFEDDEIDLNYVPKKEYNWRKNFKLDDDLDENKNKNLDTRKFSLGGESITLFSQSPEHSKQEDGNIRKIDQEEEFDEKLEEEPKDLEKSSKKKKNKRKSRKGSKGSIGEEKESVLQQISPHEEGDSTTKKKNRRESKKTAEITAQDLNQEDVSSLQDAETEASHSKKKSKKQKKPKDEIVLPKLDVLIPTPEKKAAPPSVAALRAALSAPPPEKKSPPPIVKPKKLWETQAPISNQRTTDSKNIPSSIQQSATILQPVSKDTGSVSPQPIAISVAKENGVAKFLPSKTLDLTKNSESTKPVEVSRLEDKASTTESSKLTPEKEDGHTEKSNINEKQILEPKNPEPSNALDTTTKPLEVSQLETKTSAIEPSNLSSENDEKHKPNLESSDISQNQKLETTNPEPSSTLNNSKTAQEENNSNNTGKPNQNEDLEAKKSELPSIEPISKPSIDSIQTPTLTSESVKDTKTPISAQEAITQSQSQSPLDSDILKDGGLYPLF